MPHDAVPADAWLSKHYELQQLDRHGEWRGWLRCEDMALLKRCMYAAEGRTRLVVVVATHEVIEESDG